MALLMFEGFDWLADGTGDISALSSTDRWAYAHPSMEIITASGEKYLRSDNILKYSTSKYLGSVSTIIIGFKFKYETVITSSPTFLNIYDGTGSQIQLKLELSSAGSIIVKNGDNITLGQTGTVISIGSPIYIEIKAFCHATTGTVEIKVDGDTALSLTNVDTKDNSGDNYYSSFVIGSIDVSRTLDYAHVYCCDNTGASHNDFLGPCKVESISPNGDNSIAWSRSAGTTNYENVDETGSNGDTDYVYSSTATQKDLYDFSNMASTVTSIHAVQAQCSARKEDSGVRAIKITSKSGASEQQSANKYLSTSYTIKSQIFTTKNGTNAWTKTDVDGAQFGMELV